MRGLVGWWVVARAGGGYASTQGAPGTVLKVAHVCRLPCPARRRLQDLLPQAPACGTALPISCELGWLDAAASGGGGRTEGRNDEELISHACPAGRITSGASTHSGRRTKYESCTNMKFFIFAIPILLLKIFQIKFSIWRNQMVHDGVSFVLI